MPSNRSLASILFFLSTVFFFSACKTSGDIASHREFTDPTEIKTVENEALVDKRTKDPEVLVKELEMAQGELEVVKTNTHFEAERLKAKIAELEKQNQLIAEELNKTRAGEPPSSPVASTETNSGSSKTGAAALWEIASNDIKTEKFSQAISSLQEITKSYSKDKIAFAAMANLALCQFKTAAFSEAAVTFNQMIDRFPKRKELALAWFGQASSFAQLKQLDDAKLIFEEVKSRYPKSNEAALAKKILKKTEKVPNDLFSLARNYPSIAPL